MYLCAENVALRVVKSCQHHETKWRFAGQKRWDKSNLCLLSWLLLLP